MALNPDKYENDPRALAFKNDPVMALLNESLDLVETPEDKSKIEMTKILVDKEKGMDEKLEAMLPAEHRASFKTIIAIMKKANEFAKEARRKKNELQIAMIGKAVEPLWKMKDTENVGHLTRDQTGELVEAVLAKIGQQALFNKEKFGYAFDMFIMAADLASGKITQDDIKKV